MAEKKTTTATTITDEPLDKARGFWASYSKPIIYIGSTIIVLILGWYAYQEFIVAPKEQKASEALFPAESLFDNMVATSFGPDSAALVLNGGNLEGRKITGVLKVIKDFGGTKPGNRARYIAGATYLHIKQFDKAINYLEDFDANGAHQVESKAHIMMGHAYAELNKTEKALEHYRKASRVNKKDDSITPEALLLAASYAESTGKHKEAIEIYTELRDTYPAYSAVRSGDVDKYLARLGVLK